MSEYRGEQAEMNIQRLNVRIDQVRMVVTVMLGDLNDVHAVFKRESEWKTLLDYYPMEGNLLKSYLMMLAMMIVWPEIAFVIL